MDASTIPAVAAGLTDSLVELAGAEWEGLDGGALLETAAALAKARRLVDAALVEVADRLESTDVAAEVGWASPKDFMTHLLGERKGAGGGLVRLAVQTRDLPDVRSGLRTGRVSVAQARAMATRVGTLPRDPEIREAAAQVMIERVHRLGLDATDLDRGFPSVIDEIDPNGVKIGQDLSKQRQERGTHSARFLSFATDCVGGVKVSGYGTAEDAERIKTVLLPLAAPHTTAPGACGGDPTTRRPMRDAEGRRIRVASCPDVGCDHTGRDPRDPSVRLWDALVDACDRLQGSDRVPRTHGTPARMTITMDYNTLVGSIEADSSQAGTSGHIAVGAGSPVRRVSEAQLGYGERLSAAAARRLACDAEIIPIVLGSRSEVLDVGRAQRLVTGAMWSALLARDRHCAFPGCQRMPLACDAHHIQHWADGGLTSLDNLVMLCRRHHTITHQTPWTVRLDPRTKRPVWRPPPEVDDRDRFTYVPPWQSSA